MDGITDSMGMSLVSSRSWWWTGRPGMLQFTGLQRVQNNWVTELNWTELNWKTMCHLFFISIKYWINIYASLNICIMHFISRESDYQLTIVCYWPSGTFHTALVFFFFIWRIIALQYCVGLCHTTCKSAISIPSLLRLLPTPPSHPPRSSLSAGLSSLRVIWQLPTGSLFHTW